MKVATQKLYKSAVAASKRALNCVKHWDEPDMQRMFKADAKDWMKIADLLSQGKVRQAAKKHWNMDTAAREACSQSLYNFLTGSPGGMWYN